MSPLRISTRSPAPKSTWTRVMGALGLLVLLTLAFQRGAGMMGTSSHSAQGAGRRVLENSGLALRSEEDRSFWTIADSGSAPVLYAIDAQGKITHSHRVQVPKNTDWEDLASDGQGRLFIADIGDNHSRRPELSVIELRVDSSTKPQTKPQAVYRVRYPKKKLGLVSNLDAEGLVFLGGQFYLFTKRRGDTRTDLYRFFADPTWNQKLQRAERILKVDISRPGAWFHFGDMVTGATLDASARRLALLTYRGVLLFEDLSLAPWTLAAKRPAAQTDARIKHLLARPPTRWSLPSRTTRQVEGIVFAGDKIVISNEEGMLFDLHEVATKQAARK